ncbi:MAG TPA: cytochrome P450 [Isosphaeraceae bacterium]|jgi:cytochrome P450
MATTTAIARPARAGRPPGPKGHWLRGHLGEFRADRLGFLTDCARAYGDVVAIRLGPARIWVLNHPDLVEEVLVHQNRRFIKHFALRAATPSLGRGLLTSEGDFWRRQRRLAQPAFQRDRVAAYGRVMVEYTERMLATWADGQARDVQADMMRLTLEIVTKTLFDADIAAESAGIASAMETLMASFTDRVSRLVPLPTWLPVPANVRFREAMRRVETILFGIIAQRRRSGEDHGDLLSMLLHAQDTEGDGRGMTDRQLRDEAVTLFMAGHETTANTLAWIWLLLARHPEAEARLHAELDAVLGGRAPTVADLPRLPYTDWVVTEALRVLPTVWLLGREAIEPTVIGGYRVPKGTTLWMSQWVLHRDARWFTEPESFRPERWADGLAKRIPRYAYFPFGGGPRVCIGNHFAQMEAVLLLATIARRYRVRVPEGAVVTPIPTMTLRPEGGVPAVLQRRGAASA